MTRETDPAASLLGSLRSLLPAMQDRARALDAGSMFPAVDIDDLRTAGVLVAALPGAFGGLGLGTETGGATGALQMFRLLGRGNLAVGRLIEAHVNALRLVFHYGHPALQRQVAAEVGAGHIFGLWVTDPPSGGLRVGLDGALDGDKQFCSGAGHVSRAVVTAVDPEGNIRLVYANGTNASARPLPGALAGMRAATTGQMRYDHAPGIVFGEPGAYLREPDFSCGAWRTSAVTLGGIEALVEEMRRQLVGRDRASDPHQQARFGETLIATETARLWMTAAAALAEDAELDPGGAIAYVGLARLAVERAATEVIGLTQRSLGIAALMRTNPVELLCRNLTTYLRQPAADMVLTEAAARALKG